MAEKVCRCHGEPMDRDKGTNGGYRCAVKRREKQLRYWHRHEGGYVKRRRRDLAAERQHITERLTALEQEAHRLC